MGAFKCSVIIPTFRQTSLLEQTLTTLSRQSLARDEYELVVVDNNTDPQYSTRVREAAEKFSAVSLHEPKPGAAAARNRGVDHGASEIVVFVDDDIEVREDFLQQHLAIHQRDEKAVVVGRVVEGLKTAGWFGRFLNDCQIINRQPDGATEVDFRQFYGANASVRKRWIVEAGMFDPTFLRRQDGELAFRLKKMGLNFRSCPSAVAIHHSQFSPEGYLKRARDNGYYLAMLWTKHPELKVLENEAQYRGLKPIVARVLGNCLFALGWLVYPITPLFVHKGFVARVLVENVRGIRDFETRQEC